MDWKQLSSSSQLFQPFSRQMQSLIFLAETESNLLRASLRYTVKTGTRYAGNPNLTNQVARKLYVVRKTKSRNVSHDVVSAIGPKCSKPCIFQDGQK